MKLYYSYNNKEFKDNIDKFIVKNLSIYQLHRYS